MNEVDREGGCGDSYSDKWSGKSVGLRDGVSGWKGGVVGHARLTTSPSSFSSKRLRQRKDDLLFTL